MAIDFPARGEVTAPPAASETGHGGDSVTGDWGH